MKVLAIDPGYGRCGFAVVERSGGKDVLSYSDCVETSAKEDFTERLANVVAECARLIEDHEPQAVAIEKLFFSANQKTAMRVAEVRGALIQCATEHDLAVFEYSPSQIKSAVASSGRADKRQIAAMLTMLMKIEKPIRFDDEFDAIAVGVAHLALFRAAMA